MKAAEVPTRSAGPGGGAGRLLMPVLRVAVLTAVYLLVLTSVEVGDVAVGLVLATALVLALRTLPDERRDRLQRQDRPEATGARLAGVPALIAGSIVDVAVGAWQVARCCVRGGTPAPGLVEVPMGERSVSGAAIWAIRTGLAPDGVVVDVDRENGVLLLHVLDASDPAHVVERERRLFARRQFKVFP